MSCLLVVKTQIAPDLSSELRTIQWVHGGGQWQYSRCYLLDEKQDDVPNCKPEVQPPAAEMYDDMVQRVLHHAKMRDNSQPCIPSEGMKIFEQTVHHFVKSLVDHSIQFALLQNRNTVYGKDVLKSLCIVLSLEQQDLVLCNEFYPLTNPSVSSTLRCGSNPSRVLRELLKRLFKTVRPSDERIKVVQLALENNIKSVDIQMRLKDDKSRASRLVAIKNCFLYCLMNCGPCDLLALSSALGISKYLNLFDSELEDMSSDSFQSSQIFSNRLDFYLRQLHVHFEFTDDAMCAIHSMVQNFIRLLTAKSIKFASEEQWHKISNTKTPTALHLSLVHIQQAAQSILHKTKEAFV